jgi:hypothetical protein
MTGNTVHNDNVKSIYGTGNDLQIFHNGSHSFIDGSSGAGSLYIRPGGGGTIQLETTGGSDMITAGSAAVTLYSSGVAKLATTSAGIYVTGEGYSTAGWGVGTGETPVGKIFNSSGVFSVRAETARQIAFGNVTNGEAIRIDTVGNVGIGTTSPSQRLEVNGNIQATGTRSISSSFDANHYMRIESNSSGGILKGTDGGVITTLVRTYGDSYFNGGNVGIGTTSPGSSLHIGDGSSAETISIQTGNSNDAKIAFLLADGTERASFKMGGDEDLEMDWNSSDNFIWKVGGLEKARFDGSGNLGIGTTSPSEKLEVTGPIGSTKLTGYKLIFTRNANNEIFTEGASSTLSLGTNSVEKMRITSAGNVGIGTTSPSSKLDVAGEIKSDKTANGVSFSSTGGGSSFTAFDVWTATNGGLLRLYNEIVQTINIDGRSSGGNSYFNNGGNVGIGTVNPGHKLEVFETGNSLSIGDNTNSQTYMSFANTRTMVGYSGANALIQAGSGKGIQFNVNNDTFNSGEAMRITLAGNVGIGTTSPNVSLQVQSNTDQSKRTLRLAYDNSYYFDIAQLGAGGVHYNAFNATSGGHKFQIDGAEKMRVAYSGNVGIGTTSPGNKLSISGPSSNQFEIINSANSKAWRPNVNGNDFYITESGVSNPFVIQAGGNVGIGTTSPSSKLQVAGGVQMADDTDTASADKVGTQRYRVSGNNSYVDMCMQTGAATYAWINIVQNNW